LTDAEIQAVVDDEAGAGERAHARACDRCAARVVEQRARVERLERALLDAPAMPAGVGERLDDALARAPVRTGAVRGATRLRAGDAPRRLWRHAGWGAVLATAAAVIIVLLIVPLVNGPGTVSASEILGASLQRLSEPAAGVEFLEYELALEGIPRELVAPDAAAGAYRIRRVVDHSVPGRYFVASFAPDGRMLSAVAQDPIARRRTSVVRIDDQSYRFDLTLGATPSLSMLDLERLHIEASVALMQASGDQHLSVVEGPAGRRYVIEIPQVSAASATAVWDLHQARAVIEAADYRIAEFAARGTLLGQPYSVSYTLVNREVKAPAAVGPREFDIPDDPTAIVVEGQGTTNPARDMLIGALRELAKARQNR
jgi:hypothetical protein